MILYKIRLQMLEAGTGQNADVHLVGNLDS